MKIKNKTKILLVIVAVIIVAITGFVIANEEIKNNQKVVTREESSIFFQPVENEPEKVDVYLGMKDTSSIASFQIGLQVDIKDCYDAKFDWETGDLADSKIENKEGTLKDARITEKGKDAVTNDVTERINLYFVGNKELNVLSNDENIDNIKLGTISLVPEKDENGNNVKITDSHFVVKPVEEFTKTASLAHTAEEVKINNKYSTYINGEKQAPQIENLRATAEADTSSEDSKIVVNFEVKDDTNSLESVTVKLFNEDGSKKEEKTLKKEELASLLPVEFTGIKEGKYKVQVYGTYTEGTERKENQLLKTSVGQNAEVDEVEVGAPSIDPSDSPETSPSPEASTSPEATTSPEASASPEATSSPENGNGSGSGVGNGSSGSQSGNQSDGSSGGQNGWSAQDHDKGKQTIVDKIVNSFKTGANHSVTWAIVTLIVLILVAIKIISVKKRHGKRYKK